MKQRKALTGRPVNATAQQTLSHTVDGNAATIYLYDLISAYGGWSGDSAAEFAATLAGLPDDVDDITVRVNSPGGDVFEAVAIVNLLRSHAANVTARIDGIAASAASFIAASADETIIGQNAQVMIHNPAAVVYGEAGDLRKTADLLDGIRDNIASIYAAKAGDDTDWSAAMDAETWYSADEAVTAGLADRLDGDDPGETIDDSALVEIADRMGWQLPARMRSAEPLVEPAATDEADRSARLRSVVARRLAEARLTA